MLNGWKAIAECEGLDVCMMQAAEQMSAFEFSFAYGERQQVADAIAGIRCGFLQIAWLMRDANGILTDLQYSVHYDPRANFDMHLCLKAWNRYRRSRSTQDRLEALKRMAAMLNRTKGVMRIRHITEKEIRELMDRKRRNAVRRLERGG